MDKLEAYVDQVCRGIAGSRALRQHIRQELMEHLRDAAAVHQAAGLSESEAINRALEDFGGPEQVRAELEATHGHRLMTVVLDKALLWKEKTMKARWLWSTAAHLTCCLLIVGQVLFIYAAMIFILPKFRELVKQGWVVDPNSPGNMGALNQWALNTLINVASVCQHGLWIGLAALVAWILFEWRFRGENKTLVRLSALGTVSLGLFVPVAMTAAALVLPLIIVAGPPHHRDVSQEVARLQAARFEASLRELDQAVAKRDWGQIIYKAQISRSHLWQLEATGAGTPLPWTADNGKPPAPSPFAQTTSALKAIEAAGRQGNQAEVDTALQQFQVAFGQLKRGGAGME